jgi:hypothetical protein
VGEEEGLMKTIEAEMDKVGIKRGDGGGEKKHSLHDFDFASASHSYFTTWVDRIPATYV